MASWYKGGMLLAMPPPLSPDDRIPAAALVAALAETDVSQSELGRRLGMTFQSVNRWANGHSPISRARWLAVLGALDLPATWQPSAPKAKASKPARRRR